MSAKGYLLTKKKSAGVNSNCTNGINSNKDANHNKEGKWER